ncbi:colorectal mutant cancer protein-like isoform X2 [Varroa jacobsoni]|nr:colorectal mutant cancer protein-like isoform X2 [Varroa jacobsoni]
MSVRGRSAGDRLLDSLAENYEQRLAQLQNVIQDLTDRLETSSQESVASSGGGGTDMPLSQCSSNENLATELSQFSPPRFASNEDLSARLDSTSKEDASGAPSSDESANNEKQKNNGANTITRVPSFCDEAQLLLEAERLRAQVDNLSCQKLTLEANLEESQSYCEQLTILLGRYISNYHLLKTLLDEEQRLLAATEQLVAVVRLEKQEVMTNARLSAPSSLTTALPARERQQVAKLKAALDKLQEKKRSMANEVAKLVNGKIPKENGQVFEGRFNGVSTSNGTSIAKNYGRADPRGPSGLPRLSRELTTNRAKMESLSGHTKGKDRSDECGPAQPQISFEEAESTLINFVHDLRAKCSTLRIALPSVDAEVLPEVTFSRTGGSGQNEMTSKEDASPHGTAPSSEAALTVQSLEALVNAQELFQLREQVASLKLTGYLQARETRFFQSELTSKEAMVDTLQEQNELLSRECQRLELALQRAACHEPPVHSGCGEALSCPVTENRLRREKFLKRRVDNLTEVSENLNKQCAAYRQLIRQLQRDNVSLLRRYERVKRKKMRPQENIEDVVVINVSVDEAESTKEPQPANDKITERHEIIPRSPVC